MSRRTAVALGSNLGDRLANLRHARDLLLTRAAADDIRSAPVYRTTPVGCPEGSPDFFNTVVEFNYHGSPLELLDLTQAIQTELGRVPAEIRNAPRTIDLDLLYLGGEMVSGPRLELPHPRLTRRRFVLQPLADIHPTLILPGDHLTIASHLLALADGESPPELVQADW